MGKPRLDPLKTCNFHCRECGHKFEAEPDQVTDAPDLEHHPFEYTAECEACGAPAEQAAWEKNGLKAHAHATGPKTPEGKAASAKNLEGHPTPEEALRTRLNAMRSGLYAKVAPFFPAKPGSYPECNACEYAESEDCRQAPGACFKKTELVLRHRIAFETKDPDLLRESHADLQAQLRAMIDMMVLAIAQDGGPRIHEIQWYYDKDGKFHLAQYEDKTGEKVQIYEIKAHPLLKPLIDFISKNNLTMADLGMTPKVQEQQEKLQGFLDREADSQETEESYRQQMLEGQEKLAKMIGNSHAHREPITVDGEVVDG